MTTQKDELVERTKAKIIELFGPESALAQAMEDDDFFNKLGELIEWLAGAVMLSQPRPETPRYPYPEVKPLKYPQLDRTKWRAPDLTSAVKYGEFTTKVTAAMTKWMG